MNLRAIGLKLAQKMAELDALVAEADKVIENDNQYWEELGTGQDSEESEQSGVLVGQKAGLHAARTLLLFDLETARGGLDLALRGLPSQRGEEFHRALGAVYEARHGEPLYADPEWCDPFVQAARAAAENDTEGCEAQYRETLRRAADAIAAVSYGPEHKPREDVVPDHTGLNPDPCGNSIPRLGMDENLLSNAQLAHAYIAAVAAEDDERIGLFTNTICHRLDLPLDETEQGLTNWAQKEVNKFVETNRIC